MYEMSVTGVATSSIFTPALIARLEAVAQLFLTMLARLYGSDTRELSELNYLLRSVGDSELLPRRTAGTDFTNNIEGIIRYAILPVVMNCHHGIVGDRPMPISALTTFDELTHPAHEIMTTVLNVNAHRLIMRNDAAQIQRVASIIMLFTPTNPCALESTIRSRTPMGLTVDFLKREEILSSDIIISTPRSHDIILTPGTIETTMKADGSLRGTMGCSIQSVSNMMSGGAVIAACAFPNTNASSMSSNPNSTPTISLDSITRCGAVGGLRDTVGEMMVNAQLGIKNAAVIVEQLGRSETRRVSYVNSPRPLDEYVGIVRPSCTPTNLPVPYTGIPRHEAVRLTGSDDMPFIRFHNSQTPFTNPYMRNLVGMYYQMYLTPNAQIGDAETGIHMTTMSRGSSPISLCATTLTLEEAMNLNSATVSMLSECEKASVFNYYRRDSTAEEIKLDYLPYSNSIPETRFTDLAVASRFGFSVPYTHRTDDMVGETQGNSITATVQRDRDPRYASEGYVTYGVEPLSHEVISSYSVPLDVANRLVGRH